MDWSNQEAVYNVYKLLLRQNNIVILRSKKKTNTGTQILTKEEIRSRSEVMREFLEDFVKIKYVT